MNRDQLKAVKTSLAQRKVDATAQAMAAAQRAQEKMRAHDAATTPGSDFRAHVGNITPMAAPPRVVWRAAPEDRKC